ncbi:MULTISPECIES: NfeD family protein [unclassified Lonepinella]|uniref:NfeD family protein n=1 Tax=unclassified Lonepinella TaxID=2642006 RepID=UPI0036D9E0C2
MEWFATWTVWHWLILGFVLLIAEIAIPGIFLLWWGLAAIVVAGIMQVFPALSLASLGIIYAILATILSVLWWKYQHKKDLVDEKHSHLNQRDHAMLGTVGIVREINDNGIGRGHFGDTTWRIQQAHNEMLQVGDRIKVLTVQGITLIVQKVN